MQRASYNSVADLLNGQTKSEPLSAYQETPFKWQFTGSQIVSLRLYTGKVYGLTL